MKEKIIDLAKKGLNKIDIKNALELNQKDFNALLKNLKLDLDMYKPKRKCLRCFRFFRQEHKTNFMCKYCAKH